MDKQRELLQSTLDTLILKAVSLGLRSVGIFGVLIGIAIGFSAALGLMRFLSGLLYGVRATSIVANAVGLLVLVLVALLAWYIPAWRALRVDPMVALR